MPRLTKNYFLNFYGGEPLLCFDLIKKTISSLNDKNKKSGKKVHYSITTNGSLLIEEIIQFFEKNKFSLVLSFDCLAQEHQREKESFKKTVSILKELLKRSNIDLEVNSVFTPITVGSLSDSMRFLMELGVSNINFSLSIITPWEQSSILKLEEEMIKLRKLLLVHHKRKANIPVLAFREDFGKGFFYCAGGKDRLALTPDEEIWGCQLFPDYFKGKEKSPEYKKFFFGTLGHFIKNHKNIYPRISSHYSQLSMENCSTSNMDCFLCSEFENCQVCPVNAAIASHTLCQIPSYVCEILKIRSREINTFRKELQKNNPL